MKQNEIAVIGCGIAALPILKREFKGNILLEMRNFL